MSRERSASAITSLPKPGALAPVGVGRSRPATAGSALTARAVADWGGVMAGHFLVLWGQGWWRIQPDHEPWRNRARRLRSAPLCSRTAVPGRTVRMTRVEVHAA